MSNEKKTVFARTDAGNAELFGTLYGEAVRYDHRQGRWLLWLGSRCRWIEDTENQIRNLGVRAARFRLKSAAGMADKEERKPEVSWAFKSENRYQLDAALDLAKSVSPISDNGIDWDADPWLFGVANGIADLRTGQAREQRPDDRITKHSPAPFDPEARCPRFEQFMLQVFAENVELIRFIQKAVGYSMTGHVTEQCLFCCYGSGANGKSTLFGVLHHVLGLGQYAANLPFSALELQSRNTNDLVMLVGSRFVTAAETREGVVLNEQRVKSLTGGDPITAKRLYHDPFTFLPTHKLWLAFNHKPIIADDSEGMWRRVRLIPFTRQFGSTELDKNLLEALKAEAPGILAWGIRGCLLWQNEGLRMPQAVADATAAYKAASDNVGRFIEDCCDVDSGGYIPCSTLWQRYIGWVDQNDEVRLSRTAFAERLIKRGLQPRRIGHSGTRGWAGIAMREVVEELCADMLTTADTVSEKLQ